MFPAFWKMLPSSLVIDASSSVDDHAMKASYKTINYPREYIFHTKADDPAPCVIIHIPEASQGQAVHLYNRCAKQKEISRRLFGVSVFRSIDGNHWIDCGIQLTDAQVYRREPITITSNEAIKYIKISRDKAGDPIHISQILLGTTLEEMFRENEKILFQLCQKYHLSKDGCLWDSKEKKILALGGFKTRIISAVYINWLGRFSNALIMLTNAILFAYKIGATKVYVDESDRIRDIFPSQSVIRCEGFDVDVVIGKPDCDEIYLQGCFYDFHRRYSKFYRSLPGFRQVCQSFLKATGFHLEGGCHPFDTMVIHIRSGDVFMGVKPHYGYGQPPLAFYQLAISHHNPARVCLVYENENNPVIPELKKYLTDKKIPIQVHSSLMLRDDVQEIIRAQVLVYGAGTFVPCILAFNNVLKKAYIFNYSIPFGNVDKNSRFYVVNDKKGEYIEKVLSGNWRNTEEQRQMMIDYEISNLDLLPALPSNSLN